MLFRKFKVTLAESLKHKSKRRIKRNEFGCEENLKVQCNAFRLQLQIFPLSKFLFRENQIFIYATVVFKIGPWNNDKPSKRSGILILFPSEAVSSAIKTEKHRRTVLSKLGNGLPFSDLKNYLALLIFQLKTNVLWN